ncbi:MAG: Fpg/Nei family DNA glycosylase [Chloroflexi bacterium]|nr:Fpg/Nei family DNA glycosylase [Chloroflexota bacterium]
MPELPELEVVQEVLQRRVVGTTVQSVEILPPGGLIVARDLTQRGFEASLTQARIANVVRRGKYLVFSMEHADAPGVYLVLNLKLMGRLQLTTPTERRHAKTHVVLALSSGDELRYVDQNQMGQLYLVHALAQVPDFDRMGPEPFAISLDEFRARLRPFRGEIKGILTRGDFVAGIGNAYADEILWAARLHPYRKRTQLTADEIERLYHAMQSTLRQAIEHLRVKMGENIQQEPRDFLAIHMKTGQPCPRCGAAISLVGANQRITNFCRTCQPGGLIRGM